MTAHACIQRDARRGVVNPSSARHGLPQRSPLSLVSVDPTKTLGIVWQMIRESDRRWTNLKIDIRKSIVGADCFGIRSSKPVRALAAIRQPFPFSRTAQKIDGFMKWLREQEEKGILQVIEKPGWGQAIEAPWTNVYIGSAYQQGIRRSRAELASSGYVPKGGAKGVPLWSGGEAEIAAAMNQPVHANRVGILFTRTFEELKSVTQFSDAAVRRKITDGLTTGLARGFAEGKSPLTIARELSKDVENGVDAIGAVRSRMIARTEIIRAHNQALVQEYRNADALMTVSILAEVLTAGDPCEECEELTTQTYTLDEADGLLPYHPNCRCCFIPFISEEK